VKNIYLVLGGSSDLGCELLRQLNETVSESVFIMHYNSNCEEIQNVQAQNDNSVELIQADLSDEKCVEELISIVKEKYQAPTHIIHLPACKFAYKKLKDFSWSDFSKDMEIQVHSLVLVLQAFLPKMAARKAYNKIVVMLSSNTLGVPPKYTMSYNMVKYSMVGLVKSVASDYAGKQICINGISPSMIDTKFLNQIDDRLIEMSMSNSVGKSNASTDEIVPAIRFLLSDESNYINGVNLNISNGNVM